MLSRKPLTTILALSAMFLIQPVAQAAFGEGNPDLYRAYYLEHETRNFAAAQKLYRDALRSNPGPEEKRAARAGADRCRDHLVARNFALLMPPDALAYFELNRPGEIIEKLCTMLGLTTDDMQEILAQRPSAESKVPFHIPGQVAISPALLEYFRSFGGAGFALTSFDPQEHSPPKGVMVIHHGDAQLLKGLLETAFQFAPTAQKIADLPTFGAEVPEVGKVCGVLTECLLIVGTSRDLVESAVGRLTGDAPSLATREDLHDVMEQRAGATLFGYVNLQGVLKTVRAKMDDGDKREFEVANAIADLDSLRWATFSLGIHEGTLGVQFAVRLADDHRSFAYNLMRLPPMSRQCLESVPADAAGIFGMGLNPALVNAAADAATRDSHVKDVTGFDIGREFFGNIRELCAFVMPNELGQTGSKRIPNGGVIMAVNDPARSKALWGQLLSIPGLIGGKEPTQPKTSKIGDVEVTSYEIPKAGKILLAEVDGRIAITTSRETLKACLDATSGKKSILKDEIMSRVLAKLPEDSSIMLVAHVGRLASVNFNGNPGAAIAAQQVRQVCSKTVCWAGLGQSPNQMTLRVCVGGLPDVNQVLKTYGPMINTFANMAMQHNKRGETRIAHKPVKQKQVVKEDDDEDTEEADE